MHGAASVIYPFPKIGNWELGFLGLLLLHLGGPILVFLGKIVLGSWLVVPGVWPVNGSAGRADGGGRSRDTSNLGWMIIS